jgi:predicted nuclease with RNAse H fold
MKRTMMHLTDQQWEAFEMLSRRTGLKVAEIYRRAADEYLAKFKSELDEMRQQPRKEMDYGGEKQS